MRGKLVTDIYDGCKIRITPADAGKTTATSGRGFAAKDHPRGCGENLAAALQASYSLGSPPRMRGKPGRSECPLLESRITPADAGKTCTANGGCIGAPDHPRGCGENY